MDVNILFFGRLAELSNCNKISLAGISDTDSLLTELTNRYPALRDANFLLAVDKKTVKENTALKEGSLVALLPPFSGG